MKKRLLLSLIGLLFLGAVLYYQNNTIVITESEVHSTKLPSSFEGDKIVQLSDLHSKSFGENQIKLIQKVKKINPNLIVFTGDLVDSNRYDEGPSLKLMEELIKIAPVYFVTGNHEWWSGRFDSMEIELNRLGVQVMRNEAVEITNGQDKISLIGIDDPAYGDGDSLTTEGNIVKSIAHIEENSFKILLAHRPEMLPIYSDYEFDLVFSGHAHGGQFRLPLFGGLIAPDQGLFPEYTSGQYIMSNTTMIVNRGLGNSVIPLRINNRPEIVVVTLRNENKQ